MQLAILETEFSPDRLSRTLAEDGFAVKDCHSVDGRVVVAVPASSIDDFSQTVTKFILSDWLSEYMGRTLDREHAYLDSDDREYVKLLVAHAVRSDPDGALDGTFQRWNERISGLVRNIILRGGSVNIRGVLRFRANEFLHAVDYLVTDAVEHFLADRDYEEFVSMLRVTLDSQPPSMQTLHVYCTDERVWICDESGNLVQDEQISQMATQVSEDGDVDAEDLTMSVLIMRSPCRIVLHDLTRRAAWPSFPETVERVFLSRVTHCEACSTCERLRKLT